MLVALLAAPAVAAAQPVPCDECARGNAQLDALGDVGTIIRASTAATDEIERIAIEDSTLSQNQAERLTAWFARQPPALREAIEALGPKSDEELLEIGFALCNGHEINCARHIALALRCAPGGCAVAEPQEPIFFEDHHHHACDPSVGHVRSPKRGLGVEYATGWQTSAHPADGRAWSFGLEGRMRLGKKLGVVARIDRSTGRDEARDDDGDGRDDLSTGAITRWSAMAGPSAIIFLRRDRELVRYWRVDSLFGYLSSRTHDDEHGLIVGIDLSYQLVVPRVGVRVLQGFGEAEDAGAILVHVGLGYGAGPQFDFGVGCGHDERASDSSWAIALDVPLGGYSQHSGAIVPGFGLEAALHVKPRVDVLVHGDLLVFPDGDRDRSLHQSMLAGARIDLKPRDKLTGFFAAALAGYSYVAGPSSGTIASGPVADVSIGWGAGASDGQAYLRLHGRFGLAPDNADLRAVFLSGGLELRFDRSQWRH